MSTTERPNGIAPVNAGTYRLGAKGGRMARAWQYIWDRLDRNDFKGSLELSREAAEKFDLKPVSVSEMLCRMRAGNVLEQKMIAAPTDYVRPQSKQGYSSGDWNASPELDGEDLEIYDRLLPSLREAIDSDGWVGGDQLVALFSAREVKLFRARKILGAMAACGQIEQEARTLPVSFTSQRPRVHYRIASDDQ